VQPPITVPDGTGASDVAIGPDGTVTAGDRRLGRIELVTVRSPQGLLPAGDNAFLVTPQSGPEQAAPATTRLDQGALEASNVDMAEAMVAMIESQRAFQLTSKAIQTQDQMWEIANGVKR
jgi:flagellar basal-body rod protein FlgG